MHDHEKEGPYMHNKIEEDIQTIVCQNNQPIRNERFAKGYGHHIVHDWEIISTGIFWRHNAPFDALGGRTKYLWAGTCPLDISYEEVVENIEGLCSASRKTRS